MLQSNIGRVTYQHRDSIPGAKFVFVKMKGKPAPCEVPIGMRILNPFTGTATVTPKIYQGDLCEYKTDGTGYIMKVYKLAKAVTAQDTTIYITADGYSHIPEAGTIVMKAAATLATAGASETLGTCTKTTYLGADVYACTIEANSLGTASLGDILVEADIDSATEAVCLVQNPNSFVDNDYCFAYVPATGNTDFDGARYYITPVLHETCWTAKMTCYPAFLNAINKSLVSGWFEL